MTGKQLTDLLNNEEHFDDLIRLAFFASEFKDLKEISAKETVAPEDKVYQRFLELRKEKAQKKKQSENLQKINDLVRKLFSIRDFSPNQLGFLAEILEQSISAQIEGQPAGFDRNLLKGVIFSQYLNYIVKAGRKIPTLAGDFETRLLDLIRDACLHPGDERYFNRVYNTLKNTVEINTRKNKSYKFSAEDQITIQSEVFLQIQDGMLNGSIPGHPDNPNREILTWLHWVIRQEKQNMGREHLKEKLLIKDRFVKEEINLDAAVETLAKKCAFKYEKMPLNSYLHKTFMNNKPLEKLKTEDLTAALNKMLDTELYKQIDPEDLENPKLQEAAAKLKARKNKPDNKKIKIMNKSILRDIFKNMFEKQEYIKKYELVEDRKQSIGDVDENAFEKAESKLIKNPEKFLEQYHDFIPEHIVVEKKHLEEIVSCLKELDEHQLELLRLHFFEEKKLVDIAKMEKVRYDTFSKRFAKIKKNLKTIIRRKMGPFIHE